MARIFKLPDYEQLSKDQDKFGRWDGRGIKLVIGGPGTGKTTVALLLAKKIINNSRDCLFLMFNHTLKDMSDKLVEVTNDNVNQIIKNESQVACAFDNRGKILVKTWMLWFADFLESNYRLSNIPINWKEVYKKVFYDKFSDELLPDNWEEWARAKNPKYFQNKNNASEAFMRGGICSLLGISQSPKKHYDFDWNEIKSKFFDKNNQIEKNSEDLLIIDEGQDCPSEFYVFIKYHFENILVTADENQSIKENNSSIKEIAENLELSDESILDITENFRNTLQISNLAKHFFCSGVSMPTSKTIDINKRNGEIPLLYQYTNFEDEIDAITKRFFNYPATLIGVIVERDKERIRYESAIRESIKRKNGDPKRVFTYTYKGTYPAIDYCDGGIVIICCASCKGLEFDEVFIGDLNAFTLNLDNIDSFKKKMYVVTSRAIDKLFILYDKNNPNDNILTEFPEDEQILRRL